KRHDSGEPLREELLKALRAEGVNTIPELVDRLLAFRESSHRKPHDGAVLAGSALARIDKPQPEHKEIVHRPPSVPLCVDGVAIEPAEIVQFNGRALHFVVSKLPQEGEVVLYAFTGTDYLRFLKGAYVASLVPQDYGDGSWPPGQSQGPGYGTQCGWMGGQPCLPPFPTPFSPPFTYWQIQMFSDSQYGGDWFWLYAGYAYPDLR